MPDSSPVRTPPIVVSGVSGTGKSRVGAALAAALTVPFIEGDDLHPAANVAKMTAGIALDDADRMPWLALVGEALRRHPGGAVAACSALARRYRDALRSIVPGVVFVQLTGSAPVLAERIASRPGHFMPVSLLESQLATLEPLGADEVGATIDTDSGDEQALRAQILAALGVR